MKTQCQIKVWLCLYKNVVLINLFITGSVKLAMLEFALHCVQLYTLVSIRHTYTNNIIILLSARPEKNKRPKRATYRAPEYNVPPFWQISQGGNFCLLIGLKNTNLVEDVEILLPVQVSLNSLQAVSEKSKMSQPIGVRAAILFFRSAPKTQTW